MSAAADTLTGLLHHAEHAMELLDACRERIAALGDRELAALHGELAREGDINGAAGELWSLVLAEQALRFMKANTGETQDLKTQEPRPEGGRDDA